MLYKAWSIRIGIGIGRSPWQEIGTWYRLQKSWSEHPYKKTVAYVLGEGKQLRKKEDNNNSSLIVLLIKQQNTEKNRFCSFNTDL